MTGILVLTLLGGVVGFGVGVLFFPLIAGAVALVGTIVQHRSNPSAPSAHRYQAFHRAAIQVHLPPAEVESELANLLQEELAATTFSVGGHRLHAVFRPPEWAGWWRRWTLSDELIIDVIAQVPGDPGSGGCDLEVEAGPLSRLLYQFLWIDQGRNYRRLRRLKEVFGAWLAAEHLRQEAARKSDSLEARLAQAELLLLRAQVEPHFLFNTLAHLRVSISGGDASTALSMLDHLIAYSRSVSDRVKHSTHSLEQEVEAARGYLSLIEIRFGDKVGFELKMDPETLDCEVPVGVLLIPLENAIKHGLEPRKGRGFVRVGGHLEAGSLVLEVQDDGPGLQGDLGSRQGTGLANLRERMKIQFSEAAHLSVVGHEAGGVLVRVQLPIFRKNLP